MEDVGFTRVLVEIALTQIYNNLPWFYLIFRGASDCKSVALASVVQIHLPPPRCSNPNQPFLTGETFGFWFLLE